MRIAFLLLCHKNFDQVDLLLSALSNPHAHFFIHIDKKASCPPNYAQNKRLHFVPNEKRHDVRWGTFSQVEASLELLRMSAQLGPFDYYVLLSGQDFPLMSVESMLRFFQENPKSNYLSVAPSLASTGHKTSFDKRNDLFYPTWMMKRDWLSVHLRKAYLLFTGGRTKTIPFLKRKKRYKFYFGSSWWAFTHDFVEWGLRYLDEDPSYCQFFKTVCCPDESFYQTLFFMSPMASSRKDYLFYIDWTGTKNGSPRVLNNGDYDLMLKSGKMFARKFDLTVDAQVVKRLIGKISSEKSGIPAPATKNHNGFDMQ